MFGAELQALQGAGVGCGVEGVHFGAEVAQSQPRVTLGAARHEFGNDLFQRRIFVVVILEGDQGRDQRTGLARLHAGRQQEEQRIEVVLFRHDAVFAQILRHHRRRHAMVEIGARGAVEARRDQGQLAGVRQGIVGRDVAESVPCRAGLEGPKGGVFGEIVGWNLIPHHAAARRLDHVRHEGIEEPRLLGRAGLVLEVTAERPDLFADFNAEPDGVVPQHHAGLALHHLRADVERGEKRIEGRCRGMDEKGFVETAMFDAPGLALDVPVLDVNLRRLREAGELLMRRLSRDDARRVGAEIGQAHGEMAGEKRMEFHESRPGLVEQDIIAEVADFLEDDFGIVDGAVVGALLDHRHAEGALARPGVLIPDQRIYADLFAYFFLVQRLVIDRADHALGVAVGLQIDRRAAAEHQRAVMGGLVVVAVEQHQIAGRDESRQHDFIGGGGAVEHEIGALGPKNLGGLLLGAERRPLVHQQVAKLQHRIVEIVAENGFAEMFDENPADRTAVVEHAAIVAGAGPELVAFLGIIDQFAKKRRFQRFGELLQAADEVFGDEFRRFLGQEDIAIDIVEHVDRQILEALAPHQQDDRHFQAAFADIGDEGGGLAVEALLAPVDHHAAYRRIGLDRQFGVFDPARLDHLKTGFFHRADNLMQAQAFQLVGIEGRGVEQECESTKIIHAWPRQEKTADDRFYARA